MNKNEFPFSVKIKPDVEYAMYQLRLPHRPNTITTVSQTVWRLPRRPFRQRLETPRSRARKWAIENAIHKWCVGSKFIHFSNKTDAALFTIFWENDDER